MPVPQPLLAFDLRFAIFLAFIVISIISWIMNQVKANQPPQAQRRPQPAPRPRNDRIQQEIDQFLKEASGRRPPPQRGEVLDADDIEIVSSPSPSRRSPPRRTPPAQRPPAPVPAQRRPGEDLAGRHLAPTAPQATPRSRMDERVAAQSALHLPHSVDQSVAKNLGVFAAEASTSSGSQAHLGTRISWHSPAATLLTALRSPGGVQQAVMMQELLQKPRALRR